MEVPYATPVRRRRSAAWLLLPLLSLAGCGPAEPLEVVAIQVGRSRNVDRTVAEQTTRFSPDQTMYAAVITTGGDDDVLITARWSYYTRVVNESTERVTPQGRTVTGFMLQNSAGFPQGPYTLEILIDGESVGERELRVEP